MCAFGGDLHNRKFVINIESYKSVGNTESHAHRQAHNELDTENRKERK